MIGAIGKDNPELERCIRTLENYYHVLETNVHNFTRNIQFNVEL